MSESASQPVLDLLKSRRSPKLLSLTDSAPSGEEIATILTIASRVPDHGKLVPWRFIIIRGDRRHELGRVIGECFDGDNPTADGALGAEARKRLAYAPLVVAVVSRPQHHPKVPEWEQVLSAGAACMNLLLAVNAMGYAAVWLTEWYAYNRRVLDELKIAAHERLAGFIHIGTSRDGREDRVRPSLSDIVTTY